MYPNVTTAQNILTEVNKELDIIHKMNDMKDTIDFYAEQYQQKGEFKQKAEKKFSLEQKKNYLEKCNKALEERLQELEEREMKTILKFAV